MAVANPVDNDGGGVGDEGEGDRVEGYPLGGSALVDEGQNGVYGCDDVTGQGRVVNRVEIRFHL